VLSPAAFQTRWRVASFATGDGKHSPLPWRPDGEVAEQPKCGNQPRMLGPLVAGVVAPLDLLRGAPTSEDLTVTRCGK